MRKLIFTIVSMGVVGCMVAAVSAGPAEEKPEASNAFTRFRDQEIASFRTYTQSLSKAKGFTPEAGREQVRAYARKMLARYEAFRESEEGKPFGREANGEILEIAIRLLGDDQKAKEVIALEKDPEQSARVKLEAIRLYLVAEKPEGAVKPLLDEVSAATKDKYPDLYSRAQRYRFVVAPVGLPFPEFPDGTKDLDGKPIKIADYKGKIVLVDFWATWDGPCLAELPNVLAAYRKYNKKGFEIIGISLDESKANLLKVIKERGIGWRQYFDGKGWDSRVGREYQVDSIPATYLVGPDGIVAATDLRGPALEKKIVELLSKAKVGEKPK